MKTDMEHKLKLGMQFGFLRKHNFLRVVLIEKTSY